jgi:hypothetical protein
MSVNDAHREDDQYNQEGTLRNRAGFLVFVLCEEEQGSQAEMLDIEPSKNVLERFREEEPASVAGLGLIVDPREEVLVQHVEQKEGSKCEAIDDGGYNGIPKHDDD